MAPHSEAQPKTGSIIERALADAARNPLDAGSIAKLGLRALDERYADEALPVVARAALQTPREAQLLHVLGLLYRETGDLAEALSAFDDALYVTPNAPILLHARARTALDAGVPSLPWFARARAAAPRDGGVILGHAAALAAEQDVRSAVDLLASMLTDHPGWIPGHSALIRLQFAQGDRTGFLDAVDRSIQIAPRDPRLHTLKIVSLLRANDHDALSQALRVASRELGDIMAIRGLTAIAATETGRLDEADVAFARVDPGADEDLIVHWLRHLLRRERPELAVRFAHTLDGERKRLAWPYLSLAWRLLESGEAGWLDRPDFVHIVGVDLDGDSLASLAVTLRALHRTHGRPLDQSVRGGTQTDGPLLSRIDPAIRRLREALHAAVSDYIRSLPPAEPGHPLLGHIPRRPRFAGSWSVRLSAGGYHDAHVHGQGWLSSAFYVVLPPGDEPRSSGCLTLGAPQQSLSLQLDPVRVVEPVAARLILFPSTLWHATQPFEKGERLTVAFDVD